MPSRTNDAPHGPANAAAATPFYFAAAGSTCLGWFHPPQAPLRDLAVVMCRPIGFEAMCAYGAYTQVSHALAQAGVAVLRFDYPGTGDSSGDDSQPERVAGWLAGIEAATQTLRQRTGRQRIALFGLRLGATLALRAAARLGDIAHLVLWAPCASGRSFARELRAATAQRASRVHAEADGSIQALGFLYTAQTLAALAALDALPGLLPLPPASQAVPTLPPLGGVRHVLLLDRDDLPRPALAHSLTQRGIATRYAVAPGYADMMQEAHEARLPEPTLALLTDWLVARAPLVPQMPPVAPVAPVPPVAPIAQVPDRPPVPLTPAPARALDLPSALQWPPQRLQPLQPLRLPGLRETPVHFGPGQALFGVLSEPEPACGAADASAVTNAAAGGVTKAVPGAAAVISDTAVLLINVGGNYRIGPNRIYTTLARALAQGGYRCLRFDLPGIGDSPAPTPFASRELYTRDATPQVRAAMDFMGTQGCRHFQLLGICSGSFVAFQTALADPRVSGQILMNSRLLEWREAQPDGQWQGAMQKAYKSTGFYRRQLLQAEVYRRLLRGDIDVRGIAQRLHTLLMAHLQRSVQRLLRRAAPSDDVLAKVKRLAARGTDTLLLVAADDDGRDYLEFHFGRCGRRLRGQPHFQMVFVEDTDHTFSDLPAQAFVIATLKAHLAQCSAHSAREADATDCRPAELHGLAPARE